MNRLQRGLLTAGLMCLAGGVAESTAQTVFGPGAQKGLDPAFELTDKALQESTPNTATQRDRADPDVIIVMTTTALQSGGLDQARQALALADRGGAHLQKMQYEEAIADLKSAVEINPGLPTAYNVREAAKQFQGKYELATEDYTRAIMLDPQVRYLVNRGIAYRQGGKYDLAIADFSEAIGRAPDNVNAYGGRAIAYVFQDRFDASIADYTALIRLEPNNGGHYANRCVVLARVGRFEDGLKDCQQALRFFPNDLDALESRGYVYFKSAQYALAIADFDTVIRVAPESPDALYGRGLAKMQTGDAAGSSADLEAARRLDPMVAETFERGGLGRVSLGAAR